MEKKELSNREKRRRRRIRSQVAAYAVLITVIAVVLAGGFVGIKAIVRYVNQYNDKVAEALSEAETSAEQEHETAAVEPSSQEDEQEPEPEPDPLDELVEALLQDMTLEEKVAGMFMVSPEAITGVTKAVQAGDGTRKALTENPVGGLLYAEKNYKSDNQFLEMMTNTRGFSKYPLFLAVRKECGDSDSFGIEATNKASELTDTDSVKNAYGTIGTKLAAFGINMNLAPVADVVSEQGNPELQGRTFGSDGAAAAPLVNAAVQALQEREVSAVLMTFPGEGAVSDGSNPKSLEELKNSDFLTYQTAIQGGVDCIMVSNVTAPNLSGDDIPCCLSGAVITDTLRNTLGFQGVVMTDMLNDSSIKGKYSEAQAAVAAIQAGADILLEPADYAKAYQGVLDAIADGTITEERIHESLYRIYRVKYKNTLDNLQ